jgi:hypothetical protein
MVLIKSKANSLLKGIAEVEQRLNGKKKRFFPKGGGTTGLIALNHRQLGRVNGGSLPGTIMAVKHAMTKKEE